MTAKSLLRVTGPLLAVLCLTGCGRGRGDVSGTITYGGQALSAGTITFFDEINGSTASAINPDGTYRVVGVPTGTAKIVVVTPMAIQFPGAAIALSKSPSLPAKYADPEQSGLRFQVRSGQQTFDISLEK